MKKFYLLTMIFALLGIGQAWANYTKIANADFNGIGGKTEFSWTAAPHATFTITSEKNMSYTGAAGTQHMTLDGNGSISITKASEGYTVTITRFNFVFGNPGGSGKITINGEERTIGLWATNWGFDRTCSITDENTLSIYTSKGLDIYSIELWYTVTPKGKPSAAVTETQVIDVTVDASNKQLIDLKSLFAFENAPSDFAFGYQVSGGVVEGDNFYATAAGDYTVKARIAAKEDCHEASAWSDEAVTISVNRLNQTLAWTNEALINTNMIIGSQQTIEATSTSGRAVTYSSSNPGVLHVDATGKLTANTVGEATITASRAQDDQYNAAESITKKFNVRLKDTPHFVPNDFVTEDSCAILKNETATITLSYVSAGLDGDFTATPADDKISVSREGNTLTINALKVGTTTLTLSQKENASFNAVSKTYKVEVLRLPNVIKVNDAAEFAGNVQFDGELAVSFTSDNTDDTPFEVEQLDGAEIAKYEEGKIIANFRQGTATWKVSQPQSESFEAAETTFSVTVKAAEEATDCYVLQDDELVEWATVGRTKEYQVNGPAAQLQFQARRVALLGFSNNSYFFAEYSTTTDDDSWNRLEPYIVLENTDKWYDMKYDIPEGTKRVRVRSDDGATGYRCVQNVRVTRKTYIRTENVELALFPEEEGKGTLTVDYSIANGGDLKLVCDNELFTLEQSKIADVDCNGGKVNIPFTFAAQTEQATYTANVTIYNAVYNKTVQLSANVRKLNPEITWEDKESAYGEVLPLDAEVNVDTLDLQFELVDETDVIELDGPTIRALKPGEAQVRAFTDETTQYNAAEKIITVTVKKSTQTISWEQELDEMEIEQVLLLEASASSELPVVFESSDPEIAYIDEENKLHTLQSGEITITAKQIGDDYFEAAEPIEKVLTVTKLKQEIVWEHTGDTINMVVGQEQMIVVTATSGLEVELTTSDVDIVEIEGSISQGNEFLGFLFIPWNEGVATVTATQDGDDRYEAADAVYKIIVVETPTTGFENIESENKVVKIVRDGQVFILHNGKAYSIQGIRVK